MSAHELAWKWEEQLPRVSELAKRAGAMRRLTARLSKAESYESLKKVERDLDKLDALPCPDHELAREAILNRLGYQYLYFWGDGEVAIVLLRLAIEIYPESANAHDSLGEAYLLAGENELAAVNYRRSLELDPGNENARAALRRLEGR